MATFDDAKRDAADLAKLVNEDTDVTTRYGTNPKVSAPKAIRLIEASGAAAVNQIQTDAANAIATLNTSRGFRVVGDFASGFNYELPNDVAIDGSGNYWAYADINALPVTVSSGTTPSAPTYTQTTFNQASAVTTTAGINTQQFIDNFELKIFQSPTDNLTKVSTFAGGVGVIYEVRKTSDNSLATIYSDKDGVTSIPQNGTANVSNGGAEAVFYIADGDYTVTINAVTAGLVVTRLQPFKNVAAMKAANLQKYNSGTRIDWQGYYEQSDGGSNWGVLKFGAHTGDDGSIFSIDANTYVEANFVGKPRVSILKFGARESNTAAQNNDSVNKAMDVAEANGTVIYVPKGRFETGQHKGRSNSGIIGAGRESVLIRNRGLSDFGALLFIEGGSANPNDNIKNYTIKNVAMEGDVLADGFKEFKHLVLVQGVSNLYIRRVYFKGWQGDALSIRSGNNAYQNDTIRIKSCEFDGVNKNNRNAISVNDCIGLWVTGSKFINCTRTGDLNYDTNTNPPYDEFDPLAGPPQPGAIDLEPNTQDTYIRLRNIRIHNNEFRQIGGNVGCIAMFLPIAWEALTNGQPRDISVQNNSMRDIYRAFHFTQIQSSDIGQESPVTDVKILNNDAKFITDRPFWVYGLNGVRIEGNSFDTANNASRIGWSVAARKALNVTLYKNKFKFCGTEDGQVVNLYNSDRVTLEGNEFRECGVEAGGFGVPINIVGTASNVKLRYNSIANVTGRTTGAVSVTGTLVKGGNESISNDWAGLDASPFNPDLTEFGESTVATGVIASETLGQANATQLDDAVNIVSTSNTTNSGVKLPASADNGRMVTIRNDGASPCAVYPFSGDDLGQGVNSFEQLAAGSTVTYKSYSVSSWIKV